MHTIPVKAKNDSVYMHVYVAAAILLCRCGFPWRWQGRKKQYAIGDKSIANDGPAHELPNGTPTGDNLEMAFHNPVGLTTTAC